MCTHRRVLNFAYTRVCSVLLSDVESSEILNFDTNGILFSLPWFLFVQYFFPIPLFILGYLWQSSVVLFYM